MAKKKAKVEKKVTKSDFLRKALKRNPNLQLKQLNSRWQKAGNPGEISSPLYYLIRRELGIRTIWYWGPASGEVPDFIKLMTGTDEVFQFKITLLDAPRPIWRRIQVNNASLDRLHEHIQTAMGWTNSHLHQFIIDGTFYGDPLLMEEDFGPQGFRDSTKTLMSAVLPPDDKPLRFGYEYDFGDGWQHEIVFEGRPATKKQDRFPRCLEGEGACPPEDVGGVWGYADFLKTIADPEHDQHDELLEWAGGKFDPDRFIASEATRRMKQGLPDWRAWR